MTTAAGQKGGKHRPSNAEDFADILTVVIDCNPLYWGEQARRAQDDPSVLTLPLLVEQTLVFANAFLMLRPHNRIAFIAAHPLCAKFLWPLPSRPLDAPVKEIASLVCDGIKELARAPLHANERGKSLLAGALSLSLCYINRLVKEDPSVRPRILILNTCPDQPKQYISIMNSIFSAQKLNTAIDTLEYSPTPATFLQQAAHITGGTCYCPKTKLPGQHLAYLMSLFLSSTACRAYLNKPSDEVVDFKAACFCHKRGISTAFVCSVCLSIFCEFLPICSTCGVRFSINPNQSAQGTIDMGLITDDDRAVDNNNTSQNPTNDHNTSGPRAQPILTPSVFRQRK
eukprot:c19207_g2_i1.p1 GENE.c19207_g2_i1~~c19207_g2_i1.p1  ORF type:complete len:354 (+),score=59.52 c19207_g2_i1:38-1063(+)